MTTGATSPSVELWIVGFALSGHASFGSCLYVRRSVLLAIPRLVVRPHVTLLAFAMWTEFSS